MWMASGDTTMAMIHGGQRPTLKAESESQDPDLAGWRDEVSQFDPWADRKVTRGFGAEVPSTGVDPDKSQDRAIVKGPQAEAKHVARGGARLARSRATLGTLQEVEAGRKRTNRPLPTVEDRWGDRITIPGYVYRNPTWVTEGLRGGRG